MLLLLRTPKPVVRTLTAPFYGVFNADTLTAKQSWRTAGGTHVVIAARWSDLQPTNGSSLDSTALAALKAQFADAATAGLKVIFSFSTHYTPSWIKTGGAAAPRFKAQDGTEWTSSNALGDDVVDVVFSQVARAAISNFQQLVWAALTTGEKAQIQDIRLGGGPYGELHYPTPGNPIKWWGFSAPAQTGVGLATGMAVCPVPGVTPFATYTTGGSLSTAAYGLESGITAWESAATGVTLTQETVKFAEGTKALKITRTTGTLLAQARLVASERIAVTPGTTVNARAAMTNDTSGRNGAIGIEWYNGTTLLSTTWGATTAISSSAFSTVTASGVAPANTTNYGVIAGLAPDQASSSQPFIIDKINAYSGASPDEQFVEWFLDSLNRYMLWQVNQVRGLDYQGSVHMLHPSFGLRSNFTFGSTSYQQQAAEGVDYTRQIQAYPDAEVWPQATWGNAEDPVPGSGIDSDQAPWRKILALATANGRTALLACENTGGSDPDWDNNTDIARMFSSDGAMGLGHVGLSWLNWPRLNGEVSGTHATLARLSEEMIPAVDATDGAGLVDTINISTGMPPQVAVARTTVASATPNTGTNTSLSVSLGSPSNGDVVGVEISGFATGTLINPNMTTPTGWNKVFERLDSNGTPASWVGFYWRVWNTGDPTSVNFTWTNQGQMIAHATPWGSADPTTPIPYSVTAEKVASDVNYSISGTTTATGRLAYGFVNRTGTAWTNLTDTTRLTSGLASGSTMASQVTAGEVPSGTAFTKTATGSNTSVGASYAYVVAGAPGVAATAYTQTFTDAAGTDDEILKTVAALEEDSTGLADTVAKTPAVAVNDTAGTSDTTAKAAGLGKTDLTGATDTTASDVALVRDDVTGLVDDTTREAQGGVSPTDSAGLVDAVSLVADRALAVVDGAGLADAATTAAVLLRTQDDSTGASDTVSSTATIALSLEDGTGLLDSAAAAVDRILSATDSTGSSDSAAAAADRPLTLDDTAGTSDTVATQATVGLVYSPFSSAVTATTGAARTQGAQDSTGTSDTVATALAVATDLDDDLGLSDETERVVARTRASDDTAALSDSATTVLAATRTPADTAGLVDAASRALGREVADSAGLLETYTVVVERTISATDPAGATDAVTQAEDKVLQDSTGTTDVADAGLLVSRTQQDGLSLSDSVTYSLTKTLLDSVGLEDSTDGEQQPAIEETVWVLDDVLVVASFPRQAADTVAMTDSLTVAVSRRLSVEDSLVLQDASGASAARTGLASSTLGLSDQHTLTSDFVLVFVDDLSTSERVTGEADFPRDAEDLLGLEDEVISFLTIRQNPSDAMTLQDSVTTLATRFMVFAENVGSRDQIKVGQRPRGRKTLTVTRGRNTRNMS